MQDSRASGSSAGTVRSRRRARVACALVGIAALGIVAGCSDQGDDSAAAQSRSDKGPNPAQQDPGPNPTSSNPGPNDTSGGVITVDGELVVRDSCVVLDMNGKRLDLRLGDYAVRGTTLRGPDDVVIASVGDNLVVTGYERVERGRCGTRFDIDSVNGVLPG